MEYSDFNRRVKKRFAEFCVINKISQRKLSRIIGISPQNIGSWFNIAKDTMPTIYALGYLMREYGLDANWLMSESDVVENKFETPKIQTNTADLHMVVSELAEQIKELTSAIKGCADRGAAVDKKRETLNEN